MAPIPTKFRLRQDTTANWTAINPILQQGEPGWETDGKIMRMGDGVTPFMSLVRFAAVSDITEIEQNVEASVTLTFAPLRDDNSGPTAPASPVPGMRWRDTSVTPPVLRVRNAAGTAWQRFVDVLDDYIASLAAITDTGIVTRNASGAATLIPANLTPNLENALSIVRLNAAGTGLEYVAPTPTILQATLNAGTDPTEGTISAAKNKGAFDSFFAGAEQQIGVGQTWQGVSRSSNVTYQNTTGRPIMITFIANTTGTVGVDVSADNVTFILLNVSNAASGTRSSAFAIIPPDHYYIPRGIYSDYRELR